MSDWFPSETEASANVLSDSHVRARLAETRLYDAFQIDVARSRHATDFQMAGPDLVFDLGAIPVGVELKLTTRPSSFLASPSRLVSQAVRFRRQFRGAVKLVLIVLVAPADEDTKAWPPGGDRVQRLLRRSQSDQGFDQVLFSLDGSPSQWWGYTANDESPERFEGLDTAVARVRSFASSAEPIGATHEDDVGRDRDTSSPGDELPARPQRILLVADEWGSRHGGISTINRGLAVGFAKIDCQVAVAVPTATPEEVEEAKSAGVDLVSPDPLPGIGGKEALLLPPRFEDPAWTPDLIVGHGRILGP